METSVWLVDAFADTVFGGNPAGVVPVATGLAESTMQAIAGELHASETAFVLPSTDGVAADFRLRYFTPQSEVDLCGHATIGAVCGLVQHGMLPGAAKSGTCRVETNVGVLPIRYGQKGGLVWAEMGQARPQFKEFTGDVRDIVSLLGIRAQDIDVELPLGLCYTGLWDLFVPLVSVAAMEGMSPRMGELAVHNRRAGVASTHVYTRDTVERGHDFHARDFSPALGIPEDPATGTATGALCALLHRHNLVVQRRQYWFEQGYEIRRPSLISARVEHCLGGVGVFVGGSAVTALTGTIHL